MADAVVVIDVGTDGRQWVDSFGLDWDGLRYVALTPAKYRAVVLETRNARPT